MSIELMLNAVNLSFVSFSYRTQAHRRSHLFVLCDGCGCRGSGRGLAIILTIFKNRGTLQIDEVDSMKL